MRDMWQSLRWHLSQVIKLGQPSEKMADFGIVCMWWNGISFLGVHFGGTGDYHFHTSFLANWKPAALIDPSLCFGLEVIALCIYWESEGSTGSCINHISTRMIRNSAGHSFFQWNSPSCFFLSIPPPPPPRKFRHRYWKLYLWERRLQISVVYPTKTLCWALPSMKP